MNNSHHNPASQELLQLVLENAQVGVVVADKNFNILFSNKKAKEIHHLPLEVNPKHWSDYIQIFEADGLTPTPQDQLPLFRAMSGEVIKDAPHVVVSKGRKSVQVKYNANQIHDESGAMVGAVLTVHDNQDLAHTAARFQAIFEQSPLSIQILNKHGKTISINSAFRELWGITEEFAKEFIIEKYNILEDPVLVQSGQIESIRRAFQGEVIETEEFLYDPSTIGLPGRARWARGMLYPLKDAFGEVREVVIIHQDMTEQHEALHEREKVFSQIEMLVKQMPAGIIVANAPDESISLYNEQLIKMLGSLSTATEVLHSSLKRTLNGEVINQGELKLETDKNRTSYFSTQAGPIYGPDGQITSSVVVLTDITKEKRLESIQQFLIEVKSLLTSTINYDEILDKVSSAVIPYLADGCMIDLLDGNKINRIISKHFDPEVQKHLLELQTKFPPHIDSPQPSAQVIRSGEPLLIICVDEAAVKKHVINDEHACLIEKIGMRSHLALPLTIRGRIIGALSLFITSDRSPLDEEDLTTAENVARHAAIAIDNAILYKNAQSAIQLRDDFISIASHELRTPITSLNLQVEVLNDLINNLDRSSRDLPLIEKFLNNTNVQLSRLTRLVNDLLDISRISTGKLSLNRSQVNLSSVVLDIVDRFNDQLQHDGIEVVCDCGEDIMLLCDAERIDQVITNFMTNAIRYGNRKPIRISLKENEREVEITINDQGRGIRPEDHDRIFNQFERIHTDKDVNGLGLGLFINRQIVAEHGGVIKVNSQLEKGSTFTVKLPK